MSGTTTTNDSGVTPYERVQPLSFQLSADDGRNLLPLDGQAHLLHLTIENRSDEELTFTPPATAGAPAADRYHLALRFRPGTLHLTDETPVVLLADAAENASWSMSAPARISDGTITFYFLSTVERSLSGRDRLRISMDGVQGEGLGGSRETLVELRYEASRGTETPAPLSGYRIGHLVLANLAAARAPFRINFSGPNWVLSDGSTKQTLKLTLTNVSGRTLSLPGSRSDAPAALVLTCGTGNDATDLTKNDKIDSVTATGFSSNKLTQGAVLEFQLVPANDLTLQPGDEIELTIKNLVANTKAGPADLFLKYENIPGFMDDTLVASVMKSRLVLHDSNVNVHSTLDTGTLAARSNISFDGGKLTSKTSISLQPDTNHSGDGTIRFLKNDGSEAVRMAANGRIGIGQSNPAETLHVKGNILIEGGALRSKGRLTLHPDIDHKGNDGEIRFLKGNGDEAMCIDNKGDVRIGVSESVGARVSLARDDKNVRLLLDPDQIKFFHNGVKHFSIFANRLPVQDGAGFLTIEDTSKVGGITYREGTVLMQISSKGPVHIPGGLQPDFASDWIAIQTKDLKTITHPLDTTSLRTFMLFKTGDDIYDAASCVHYAHKDQNYSGFSLKIATNQFQLQVAKHHVFAYYDSNGNPKTLNAGSVRIFAWKIG